MDEPDTNLFHIARNDDLLPLARMGEYRCSSLETEGFIHCCHRQQLPGVVSRYYADEDDVCLMLIDVDKLDSKLILENTMGGDELFPHIYGPINADCIIDTLPFGIDSTERNGLFE